MSHFGIFDNHEYKLITLSNENISVSITNFGASITNVSYLNYKNEWQNLCLGFNTLQDYITYKQYYLGSICGRFANRIAYGKFSIDDKNYQVPTNLPPHHLHGGVDGFNCKYWELVDNTDNSITLTYTSIDGEEGFPGNITITVMFTLQNNNISIRYIATTDAASPINITNHAYFNLSGERTITNHIVQIYSTQLMQVDKDSIPNGNFMNVHNTMYNLSKPTTLEENYKHIALYDNTWLLAFPFGNLQKAATVTSKIAKIQMDCYTSFPSIHFYDGHFLDNPFFSKQGLCLEAQFLPDSPNQPNFPNTILQPNESWEYETVYSFSTLS